MDALELALRCSTLLKRSIGTTSSYGGGANSSSYGASSSLNASSFGGAGSSLQQRRSEGDAVFTDFPPDGSAGGGVGVAIGRSSLGGGGGGSGGGGSGRGGSTSGSASSALEDSFQVSYSMLLGLVLCKWFANVSNIQINRQTTRSEDNN